MTREEMLDTMDPRTDAIQKLSSPESWCEGAQWLADAGDRSALVPLMQAYEVPVEASKLCLLDAMGALNAREESHQLFNHGSLQERRLAIHMMELFPHDSHLPLLKQALDHEDALLVEQSLRTLRLQLQTPRWEKLVIQLLSHQDSRVKYQAIQSLSRNLTPLRRQALRNRLVQETDDVLREDLEKMLKE